MRNRISKRKGRRKGGIFPPIKMFWNGLNEWIFFFSSSEEKLKYCFSLRKHLDIEKRSLSERNSIRFLGAVEPKILEVACHPYYRVNIPKMPEPTALDKDMLNAIVRWAEHKSTQWKNHSQSGTHVSFWIFFRVNLVVYQFRRMTNRQDNIHIGTCHIFFFFLGFQRI